MFEECKLEGDFTLSSGRKSNVFYDFDLLPPRKAAKYCDSLYFIVPGKIWTQVDFVAVPALGGIIPGFWLSFILDKPLLIIDKEGKSRGPEITGGKYVVADDVVTSFQAVNKVRNALPECECLAAVSYIFRGGADDYAKQDIDLYYLERGEPEI